MALVSVEHVEQYEPSLLDTAVTRHFDRLNVPADLHPGMKVLLKPNLLAARSPSQAVTTHPEVIAAVVRYLRNHGITDITLADSPGGVYSEAVLQKHYSVCGLNGLEGVKLNTDTGYGTKNGFHLLNPVLEADYIISLCKMKTHGLTVMTGGVKNLFGCIPGLQKPEWHCRKPTVDSFSELLIKLCDTISPAVTLMDAIDGMEGNGPGGGTVKHVGLTLASRSPYALDEQAAYVMSLSKEMVPLLRHAVKKGKLNEKTELAGDPIFRAEPPFALPDAVQGKESFFTPQGIFHVFFGRKRSYPKVNSDKCVGCGKCAESCPKHIITLKDGKAGMTTKGCISCFCCQEMCPAHAIEVYQKRF